jgi:hypothetical protein
MRKLLLLAFTFSTLLLNAQTTIENFSFGSVADTLTNPSIGGASWKRHSGAGTPIVYNTTSLSYTGYSSSGVGGSISITNGTGSREDANRQTSFYNSGAVYASFLLNVTSSGGTTGDYFMHFGDSFGSSAGAFGGRLFIKDGSVSNTFKLGLTKGTAASFAVFSSVDYSFNTPILVVLKYSFNATASDTAYAFVFSSGVPSAEPTATLTATDLTSTDLLKIRSICIRQGTVGTHACSIDGIRVSNTWANSALPVSLVGFSADSKENHVELNWSTSSETNNKGFEIERSVDGNNFSKIAFAKGAGNSNRLIKYHFIDDYSSSAYYRLKQLDFDGKFEYSKVIAVKAEKEELKVELSPNPFGNRITIQSNNQISKVEIIDITGKVKLVETINGKTAEINTSEISNGIYFLRINDGETILTQRIIKN